MVKKLQTLLILTLVPVASFASAKAISAFVDTDLLIVMKMAAKSNTHTHLILLLAVKIFKSYSY